MTVGFSDAVVPIARKSEWFRIEASQVLDSLRNRIAEVLSELGVFTKPAEVQRALQLDKTLSRQVFKLACNAEPMAGGSLVPSEASIHRFLDVAKGRGIDNDKIQGVVVAYKQFAQMIRTHAGDRVTFNSMVAGADGVDDEWLAADLQHRRHGFRAMSHAMGMQMKTQLKLFVIKGIDGGRAYEVTLISGCIGLRMLRRMPSVRVHGASVSPLEGSESLPWEPLRLTESLNGDLLESFCSKPLPVLKVSEGSDDFGTWRQIEIDHPEVGNMGTSTLLFGTICRRVPIGSQPLRVHSTAGKPAEVQLFDVLIDPSILAGGKPVGRSVLGYNEKFGSEIFPLEGKFDPELLGRGPAALSTPEVPRYTEMLGAVSQKIGRNLSEFNAWRLRLEFPLYQSTSTMSWGTPE